MAKFCTNCGASLTETAKFCNKCGMMIGQAQSPSQPQPQAPPPFTAPPPPSQAPPSFQSPPSYQQPPYQARPAAGGLQPNIAGLLCYVLGLITGIIFLVLDPYNKDRFVRFHAFQAIFLHVAWIVLWVVLSVIANLLPWPLQVLASILYLILGLGGLLLWLFMMYKAYNHETFKLPVIGDLAQQQAG
jgi:uncharacterized membrane protein